MAASFKREPSIDLMRFIGLTFIILAHVGVPRESALFQLRTFDVPLMIFTSGLAFAGKTTGNYLPFVLKRTLRLIVPVYLFVAAYVLLNPVLSGWGLVEDYSMEQIAGAFMLKLYPSIGYVWIIRVFLIVMLVTPFLLALDRKMKNDVLYFSVVALLLVAQHFLIRWLKPLQLGSLVDDWILYLAGYSAVFMLGLRLRGASYGVQASVSAVTIAVMAAYAAFMRSSEGTWLMMQELKYPPAVYFLLWGSTVSCVLWISHRLWTGLLDNSLFIFIGRNTIWIYLWHIPFVNIVMGGPFDAWAWGWKYAFVYAAALCVYGAQYQLVKLIDGRWPDNPVTKYFVG